MDFTSRIIKNTIIISIVTFFFSCLGSTSEPVKGQNFKNKYYVSNNGNDNANGKTRQTAWKSINKLNSARLHPGDSVFFEKGSTWNETLEINSSGEKNNHIFYGAYGNGNRPRIIGSKKVTSWTKIKNTIWVGDQTIHYNPFSLEYSAEVFFTDSDRNVFWGDYQEYIAEFENMTKEFDWTWNDEKIYIYSTEDPNQKFSGIECPQIINGIKTNGNSYITIDNLFLGFFVSTGIRDPYGVTNLDALYVTNCEIAYIGKKNSSLAYGLSVCRSNSYYAFNKIHDCGRRSISINMYDTKPIGRMHNVIIEGNHFYNGFHTTGVDCINSGNHIIDSIVIRNNLFEGDQKINLNFNPNSNHCYIANQTNNSGIISNIYIYNNIFTFLHGKGVGLAAIDTAFIVFNTFYGWNSSITNGQAMISVTGSYCNEVEICNNIFYHNKSENSNPALECIFINNAYTIKPVLDHNLYFAEDPYVDILEFFQSGNNYFDREIKMYAWKEYKDFYKNYDVNSPEPADPLFNNPPIDFSLKKNSPAREKGKIYKWIYTDYWGSPMKTPPDIGAIQSSN